MRFESSMRKNRNDGQVFVNSPVRPSILYISLTLVEGQFDAILPGVIGNIPRNCICIVTLSCGMDRKEERFCFLFLFGVYHRYIDKLALKELTIDSRI